VIGRSAGGRSADGPGDAAGMVGDETDAHPEEALDHAIAGVLYAREQQDLARHLKACRACGAHLALARSRDETFEPRPWDPQLNRRAVERALASVERGRWSTPIALLLRRRGGLVAAGLLFGLGSGASAAWWHMQRSSDVDHASPPRVVAKAITPAPSSRRKLAVAAPVEPPPVVPAEDPGARSVPRRAAPTQPSAAWLFLEASGLRDRNRPDQAIAVFRRMQRLYPKARETRISFALAGRMLLDRGRPVQALAQFDRHLEQSGEASEEALAGRATALGRMGCAAAERETWQRLLVAYPRSVYAAQAEERLRQLGDAPGAPPAGTERPRSSADDLGRERSERTH
jgi:tetratricopeptide (TPR) repeat protein